MTTTLAHADAPRGVSYGDMASVAQSLLHVGPPAPVPVPGLADDDITRAWQGLERFDREVPIEEQRKYALQIPRHPLLDQEDDGIIRKSGIDKKLFLHYRPDLPDHLLKKGISLSDWQEDWLASCDTIRTACLARALTVAQALDRYWPGSNLHDRLVRHAEVAVLRVLSYESSPGQLAAPHHDRSAFSLHIKESRPGLYCMLGREKAFVDEPQPGHALIFPGKQLSAVLGVKGIAPPLLHGVDNIGNLPERRWALVFFCYL